MNRRRIRLSLFSVFFFILLAIGLVQLVDVRADGPDGKDHEIIILIDNSRSVALTNDRANNRIRTARFLARFLRETKQQNVSLGVIRFATTPLQLVPLKLLSDWSMVDVERITPEYCPEKGDCTGTMRHLALNKANEALAGCLSSDKICDVILLTDALIAETGSSSQQEVEQALETLAQNGIRVHVVLYYDESRSVTVPGTVEETERARPIWEKWQKNDGLIQTLLTATAPVDATALYSEILHSLQFGDILSEFTRVEESTTVGQLPPLMRQLTIETIPDPIVFTQSVTTSFLDVPKPIEGEWNTYIWPLPDFDQLTMTVSGAGQVFYHANPESISADIFLSFCPENPKEGKPLSVHAFMTGSNTLLDTARTKVQAVINPGHKVVNMVSVSPGKWQYPDPGATQEQLALKAGEYQLSASVKVGDRHIPVRTHIPVLHVYPVKKLTELSILPTEVFTNQIIHFETAFYSDDIRNNNTDDASVLVLLTSPEISHPAIVKLEEQGAKWVGGATFFELFQEKDADLYNHLPLTLTATVRASVGKKWPLWISSPVTIRVLPYPSLHLTIDKETKNGELPIKVQVNNFPEPVTPTLILPDGASFVDPLRPISSITATKPITFYGTLLISHEMVEPIQAEVHYEDPTTGERTVKSNPVVINFHKCGIVCWLIRSLVIIVIAILLYLGFIKWLGKSEHRKTLEKIKSERRKTLEEIKKGKDVAQNTKTLLDGLQCGIDDDAEEIMGELTKMIENTINERLKETRSDKVHELYGKIIELVGGGNDLAMEILVSGIIRTANKQRDKTLRIVYLSRPQANPDYYGQLFEQYQTLESILNSKGYADTNKDIIIILKALLNIKKALVSGDFKSFRTECTDYVEVLNSMIGQGVNTNADNSKHAAFLVAIWKYIESSSNSFEDVVGDATDEHAKVSPLVSNIYSAIKNDVTPSKSEEKAVDKLPPCLEKDAIMFKEKKE